MASPLTLRTKSFVVPLRCIATWELIAEHRPDLIVGDQVVVEVKSIERFNPVFVAQMLTYLRLTGLRVGLILNFNRESDERRHSPSKSVANNWLCASVPLWPVITRIRRISES
jgi:PD-(D/E)XK nuclease superfamily